MMKTGVMQFGFAPVFYIPQFDELPKLNIYNGIGYGTWEKAREYPNVFSIKLKIEDLLM